MYPPVERLAFVVREENQTFAGTFSGYPEHVLLFRPDYYVAATIPLSAVEAGAAAVEALLDATWPAAADRRASRERMPGGAMLSAA